MTVVQRKINALVQGYYNGYYCKRSILFRSWMNLFEKYKFYASS